MICWMRSKRQIRSFPNYVGELKQAYSSSFPRNKKGKISYFRIVKFKRFLILFYIRSVLACMHGFFLFLNLPCDIHFSSVVIWHVRQFYHVNTSKITMWCMVNFSCQALSNPFDKNNIILSSLLFLELLSLSLQRTSILTHHPPAFVKWRRWGFVHLRSEQLWISVDNGAQVSLDMLCAY